MGIIITAKYSKVMIAWLIQIHYRAVDNMTLEFHTACNMRALKRLKSWWWTTDIGKANIHNFILSHFSVLLRWNLVPQISLSASGMWFCSAWDKHCWLKGLVQLMSTSVEHEAAQGELKIEEVIHTKVVDDLHMELLKIDGWPTCDRRGHMYIQPLFLL